MRISDGRLSLSPTDLTAFLACPHLTRLESEVARGKRDRPLFDDPHAALLRRKGHDHEWAYHERLRAAGRTIVDIPHYEDSDFNPVTSQRLTEAAIREAAADVIYQPYLGEDAWRGFADFLERQADGSYEPVDTKLARTARPEHLLQLCFYAEQLARVQNRLPERVHVELGSGRRESFLTAEFMAYYRRVRTRFLEALEDPQPTYPWPCEHCTICGWRRECHRRLTADDSPVLVAGLGRAYVERLSSAGFDTLARIGDMPGHTRVEGVRPEMVEAFRHQAALQLVQRRTGEHRFDLLPVEPGRGFQLLPEPSPADVWLDLEGHPFYEPRRGLEYLFGFCHRDDDGEVRYQALWAKDPAEEKRVFEAFVDWVVARRRRVPGMHVYHYAHYERSALLRLMGEHGTREDAIDDLLRGDVLVDLYRVTRQALRASVESYSIKKVEALYGFERAAEVMGGAASTVLFERWLECGDAALLEAIAHYNEEDCRSAAALHAWLLGVRPAGLPWRPAPVATTPGDDALAADAERAEVIARLTGRSHAEGDTWWLLAQLAEYHRREARPQWWEWFHHQSLDEPEMITHSRTLGGLEPVGAPVPDKRSLVYTLSFPPQDHASGGRWTDPATQKDFDGVVVDDDRGLVTLRRGLKRRDEPLPTALIPGRPLHDREQRAALLRVARSYLDGDGAYPALRGVLERTPPRADLTLPPPEAVLTLDHSHLFVQGPPGAGKTWQGAKAAVALMRAGRRIGVTSLSHRAINKLLQEIEAEAMRQAFLFRGLKKHSDEEDAHHGTFIQSSEAADDLLDPGLLLIAGTAWLFARAEFDQHATVPADAGVFLAETWRLRPELCAFTSEAYYEQRLTTAAPCGQRRVHAGDGLVVRPVAHAGCSQWSREEAAEVAREIERLLGTPFSDGRGATRPLALSDFLVVAPYNAQVRMLRSQLPDGVAVGTVDKFQGQEAAVVIVSTASSSGADAPRGIGFAFNRHRVNVATSRAQCRVVLVCSPRLLEAECTTIDHMRLMNAVCRFVELARP